MSANDATSPHPDTVNTSDIVSTEEEVIHPLGWMTSTADWLFRVGKSFGITKEHILLGSSVLAFALLAMGFFLGVRYDRSRVDVIDFDGERYQCVGLMKDNNLGIYMPFYKKSIDVMRGK